MSLVVGSLALSSFVILVLVGLGDKWFSSTSYLVMASTVIFVNLMKMEACQLFKLEEASSSTMAGPSPFQGKNGGLKLLKMLPTLKYPKSFYLS